MLQLEQWSIYIEKYLKNHDLAVIITLQYSTKCNRYDVGAWASDIERVKDQRETPRVPTSTKHLTTIRPLENQYQI